ncbi:30S ribosomal protein S5 [Nitzschia inconspicua]|uniref:30S ribosomal protein S5 n=1 Tax=Nitzschia inconspicua TaxID=303405 RepID=A0A9K3M4I8_9STRA|nr:30S ribosomal protein S5 [Nitzschia inconspicua]
MIPSSVCQRTGFRRIALNASKQNPTRNIQLWNTLSLPSSVGATASSSLDFSVRWKSGKSGVKSFRPRRAPSKEYFRSQQKDLGIKLKEPKGPKEPYDVSTPIPKIDLANDLHITDVDNDDDDNDWESLGPLMSSTLRSLRAQSQGRPSIEGDVEAQLRMMDFFTSDPGSTEDLVASRRFLAMEALEGENPDEILAEIDRMVDEERTEYMDLPPSYYIGVDDLAKETNKGSTQIPHNQLAHGEWGEMLIRTDRVCKMWRGGRIESYRALVVGGNLRGCGGFGVGKAFEPEDAVEIACRMAKRNIFFVDRYRGRGLTRDLVGRQNSCKVYLRATDNGLRGNPLCCEILKLMGITNVVAKAHGSRNHYNVVRATYKALLTHESLEEIAMKRGVRLINLQKAKRLQI